MYESDPTTGATTLVQLLRKRATVHPDRRALTFLVDGEMDAVHMTYATLDRKARAIAAALQCAEAAGERAILLYQPGLGFVTAFLGCLYAGVIAVPMSLPPRNRPDRRLEAVVTNAEARWILTTASILCAIEKQRVYVPALASIPVLNTDSIDDTLALSWQVPAVSSKSLAYLQYTSGSTGIPKGAMVSHGNLLYNSAYIRDSFGITPESVTLSWVPGFHDMGLVVGIVQSLYVGIGGILMPPVAFIQQPVRWLRAVTRYGVTHSGGPNFAYDLCVDKIAPEQRQGLDLSNWRNAWNGAEPVRWRTLERFAATYKSYGFHPRSAYPGYGLAETVLLTSGGLITEAPVCLRVEAEALEQHRIVETFVDSPQTRIMVGSGRSWLDTSILIVDPQSRRVVPNGHVGEIWVSGPSVTQGYWNRPKETRETFQARLASNGAGPFLRTGDRGFLQGKELFITGRLKDIIIIHGRNLYPHDIELTVEQCDPALRSGCGAAFSVEIVDTEQLVVVQEVKRTYLRDLDAERVLKAVRSAIWEEYQIQIYAISLVKTGSIPKTTSGKIQRRECQDQFFEGRLYTIAAWKAEKTVFASDGPSSPQVADPILRWIVNWLANKQDLVACSIDPSAPFADYGLDSISAIELTQDLFEWLEHPDSFEETMVWEYPTPALLADYLRNAFYLRRKNA